jgi:hypothetical protein
MPQARRKIRPLTLPSWEGAGWMHRHLESEN